MESKISNDSKIENKTSDNAKIKFLELIRDQPEIIFGAFSAKCTKKQKNEVWENITKNAIDLGLLPSYKDSKYVREVYWQNIRRRTVKKLDESRTSGAAGGSEMIFDNVDNLVIDIIGASLYT